MQCALGLWLCVVARRALHGAGSGRGGGARLHKAGMSQNPRKVLLQILDKSVASGVTMVTTKQDGVNKESLAVPQVSGVSLW